MHVSKNEYNISVEFYSKILNSFVADFKLYEILIRLLNPSKLLELGCGSGRLFSTYLLAKSAIQISGIDISEEMITAAKLKYPNAKLVIGDICNYKFNEKFDLIVISNALLKHLKSQQERRAVFANAKKHLSEKGHILIDHAEYLYYENTTTEWTDAKTSIVSDWIPNTDNLLEGYQWCKQVEEQTDILKWRFKEQNKVLFETQFSTFVYHVSDLIKDIKANHLFYQVLLTNYSISGLSDDGKRFISIIGKDEQSLIKIRKTFREKFKASYANG